MDRLRPGVSLRQATREIRAAGRSAQAPEAKTGAESPRPSQSPMSGPTSTPTVTDHVLRRNIVMVKPPAAPPRRLSVAPSHFSAGRGAGVPVTNSAKPPEAPPPEAPPQEGPSKELRVAKSLLQEVRSEMEEGASVKDIIGKISRAVRYIKTLPTAEFNEGRRVLQEHTAFMIQNRLTNGIRFTESPAEGKSMLVDGRGAGGCDAGVKAASTGVSIDDLELSIAEGSPAAPSEDPDLLTEDELDQHLAEFATLTPEAREKLVSGEDTKGIDPRFVRFLSKMKGGFKDAAEEAKETARETLSDAVLGFGSLGVRENTIGKVGTSEVREMVDTAGEMIATQKGAESGGNFGGISDSLAPVQEKVAETKEQAGVAMDALGEPRRALIAASKEAIGNLCNLDTLAVAVDTIVPVLTLMKSAYYLVYKPIVHAKRPKPPSEKLWADAVLGSAKFGVPGQELPGVRIVEDTRPLEVQAKALDTMQLGMLARVAQKKSIAKWKMGTRGINTGIAVAGTFVPIPAVAGFLNMCVNYGMGKFTDKARSSLDEMSKRAVGDILTHVSGLKTKSEALPSTERLDMTPFDMAVLELSRSTGIYTSDTADVMASSKIRTNLSAIKASKLALTKYTSPEPK